MIENHNTSTSVSEQDIATLNRFAEKTLQATQMSEVMIGEPTLVQRGAIYFTSVALGFTFCLLYFGKVSVWVSAKGKIIPSKDVPLIVKAAVPNKDIGFIKVGMPTQIKVDAYPFEQFGTVPAQVRQIALNVDNDDNFTVTFELLQSSIKASEHQIKLFPGLTVQAEVRTRNQRLFELLFSK